MECSTDFKMGKAERGVYWPCEVCLTAGNWVVRRTGEAGAILEQWAFCFDHLAVGRSIMTAKKAAGR